jgi:hypothetical protein
MLDWLRRAEVKAREGAMGGLRDWRKKWKGCWIVRGGELGGIGGGLWIVRVGIGLGWGGQGVGWRGGGAMMESLFGCGGYEGAGSRWASIKIS